MFLLCEEVRTELLIKATKYNSDSVHTRACIYNRTEKLFAAVLYGYSQCMNKYLLPCKRHYYCYYCYYHYYYYHYYHYCYYCFYFILNEKRSYTSVDLRT